MPAGAGSSNVMLSALALLSLTSAPAARAGEQSETASSDARKALTAQPLASQLEALRIPGVRVLTQNLYVGLDVFPVLGAAPEEVPFVVAEAFADFVANRPDDRMAALATEIALIQPHLVGLQEVVELFEPTW